MDLKGDTNGQNGRTGAGKIVLTYKGVHGAMSLEEPGLSPVGLQLVERLATVAPGFRICGVGVGNLRRPIVRTVSEFSFGSGPRLVEERAKQILGRGYGSHMFKLAVGEGRLTLPFLYDDHDRGVWVADMDYVFELLGRLKAEAPCLRLPIPGQVERTSAKRWGKETVTEDVPTPIGNVILVPVATWRETAALSSGVRDAWMQPHLERQELRRRQREQGIGQFQHRGVAGSGQSASQGG